MTSGRETILITVLCAVSGWLGGAASARGSFFDALLGVDSLKWMLVLSFVGLVASKPWRLGAHSKYWLVWGILSGLSSGLLSLVTYFLIWPYEGHGRERVFTTVVAMLVSYPALFIGLACCIGCVVNAIIRDQEHRAVHRHNLRIQQRRQSSESASTAEMDDSSDDGLREVIDEFIEEVLPHHSRYWPYAHIGVLIMALGAAAMLIWSHRPPEKSVSVMSGRDQECCRQAYKAFITKVGVSYAIFESERFCDTSCNNVSECLQGCKEMRETCVSVKPGEESCKQTYRNCVLACPDITE